ncbi:MAG: hypothetical protein HYV97_07460 [Bdellovibrio sp.]|nr:hypothetical protein [Bdellovibrio sp.]
MKALNFLGLMIVLSFTLATGHTEEGRLSRCWVLMDRPADSLDPYVGHIVRVGPEKKGIDVHTKYFRSNLSDIMIDGDLYVSMRTTWNARMQNLFGKSSCKVEIDVVEKDGGSLNNVFRSVGAATTHVGVTGRMACRFAAKKALDKISNKTIQGPGHVEMISPAQRRIDLCCFSRLNISNYNIRIFDQNNFVNNCVPRHE